MKPVIRYAGEVARPHDRFIAMTPSTIPDRPFDHPAAWTAADLGGKDDFAFDLTDRHIAAFEAAVSTAIKTSTRPARPAGIPRRQRRDRPRCGAGILWPRRRFSARW